MVKEQFRIGKPDYSKLKTLNSKSHINGEKRELFQ